MSETLPRSTSLEVPQARELLDTLLTLPGSTGETYSRFRRYSPRNIAFLAMQGCPPEPVATYNHWSSVDRQVQRGQKAYSILRPITVKVRDEEEPDNPDKTKAFQRFKVVRALFSLSQTEGEALPPYEPPAWSVERALGTLAITRIPFELYDGNVGGYAVGRSIAVSELAPYPLRTTLHEISHIEHGHTAEESMAAYRQHRGQMEFEAEASAYVALNEIGALDDETASVSRGYVQGWLRGEDPSDASLRRVLNVATKVISAGYEREEE